MDSGEFSFDDPSAGPAAIQKLQHLELAEKAQSEQPPPPVIGPANPNSKLHVATDSKVKSLVQLAPYLGFAGTDALKNYLEASPVIATLHRSFAEMIRAYKEAHKTDGTTSRPTLDQIEARLIEIRKDRPNLLDIPVSTLATSPEQDELDNWAISYNHMFASWFITTGAPFKNAGVPPTLFLDRVNALIKVLDRIKSKDIGTPQPVAHIPYKPRTMELVQQTPLSLSRTAVPSINAQRNRALEKRLERSITAQLIRSKTGSAGATASSNEPPIDVADVSNLIEKTKKGGHNSVPQFLGAKPVTDSLGIATGAPVPNRGKARVHIPKQGHTPDQLNPKAEWFKDGWVHGYTREIVSYLQSFEDTVWAEESSNDSAQDVDEPVFDMAGSVEVEKADRKVPTLSERVAELEKSIGRPKEDEARRAIAKELKPRQARCDFVMEITEHKPSTTLKADEDGGFTSALLREQRYAALPDTDLVKDGKRNAANQNDQALRLRADQAAAIMDNASLQPTDYRGSLRQFFVKTRKFPLMPGQNPASGPNNWWQFTGAGRLNQMHRDALSRQIRQYEQLKGANVEDALAKSYSQVWHGAILADEVGIGKTRTIGMSRLGFLNERKLMLQTLKDSATSEAIEKLRNFPAPRPMLVITQPHLMVQLARELRELSDLFSVYLYGAPAQHGVRQIKENLTRDHPLFDHANEMNSQAIVVTSYQTFATRHGPQANLKYVTKTTTISQKAATRTFKYSKLVNPANPEWRAPHDLDGLFEQGILDEAQNSKGLKANSSYAIRWLSLPWTVLVTATPIPYSYRDFAGLLSFIQSPYDNALARRRLDSLGGLPLLVNPYETNEDGTFKCKPEDAKFAYTTVAFERFVIEKDLPPADIGPILARIWSRCLIRRDFHSSCIVDPKGTRHVIGQSMPRATRTTLHLKNSPNMQNLHNIRIKDFINESVIPADDGSMVLNGRSLRSLNLGALHPYLLLARDIHHVKVPADRTAVETGEAVTLVDPSDDDDKPESSFTMNIATASGPGIADDEDADLYDEDEELVDDLDEGAKEFGDDIPGTAEKVKMVESPHLREYRDSFMDRNDEAFLRKLCRDIKSGAVEHFGASGERVFGKNDVDTGDIRLLASAFIRASVRLRVMFGYVGDQIDNRDEKSLIFASSPWESMLIGALLRILGYRADALLSSMNGLQKSDMIKAFKAPLRRSDTPGFHGVAQDDLEVLVLTYHLNSGLNLHDACHCVHAASPPPSHAIWIQSCGRVIRFGQRYECIILSYHVEKTFNSTQMAQVARNALSTIAALICSPTEVADGNLEGSRVSSANLHHLHGYKGSLVDDRDPVFASIDPGELEDLSPNDKYVRVLNATLGLNVGLRYRDDQSSYEFVPSGDIFEHYKPVAVGSKTPRSQRFVNVEEPNVAFSGGIRAMKLENMVPSPGARSRSSRGEDLQITDEMVNAERQKIENAKVARLQETAARKKKLKNDSEAAEEDIPDANPEPVPVRKKRPRCSVGTKSSTTEEKKRKMAKKSDLSDEYIQSDDEKSSSPLSTSQNSPSNRRGRITRSGRGAGDSRSIVTGGRGGGDTQKNRGR